MPKAVLPKTEAAARYLHERTAEYRSRLRGLYANLLTLADDRGYFSARQPLMHHCAACDQSFTAQAAQMLQGSGCPYCSTRTNPEQLLSAGRYKKTLRSTAWRLADPRKTVRLGSRTEHSCVTCGATKVWVPNQCTPDSKRCTYCAAMASQRTGKKLAYYQGRLLDVYRHAPTPPDGVAPKVHCTDAYLLHRPMMHSCTGCGSRWAATATSMLIGSAPGICACHAPVCWLAARPVDYNRELYVVRNVKEALALPTAVQDLGAAQFRTALAYPVPVLHYHYPEKPGRTYTSTPAFFSEPQQTLIDVVAQESFKTTRVQRWEALALAAEHLGLGYRLLIVRADHRLITFYEIGRK